VEDGVALFPHATDEAEWHDAKARQEHNAKVIMIYDARRLPSLTPGAVAPSPRQTIASVSALLIAARSAHQRRRLDHENGHDSKRRASKSANYADLEPRAVNAPSTGCAHRQPCPLDTVCCVRAISRHRSSPHAPVTACRHEMDCTLGFAQIRPAP
jgi:hypothetical protein